MKHYAAENASLRLPLRFDATKLVHDLSIIIEGNWLPHFNTAGYTGDWNVIPLYAPEGEEANIFAPPTSNSKIVETTLLQRCNYFKEVIDTFECPILTARLLRLSVGAEIKPHRDFELGYEDGCFRVHIPIVTNPDVQFILNDVQLKMLAGECWYTNVNFVHSVLNAGQTDRVHLVIDGEQNEWSDKLFKAAGFHFNREKELVEQLSESTLLRMIEELELHNLPQTRPLIAQYKNDLKKIQMAKGD